MGCGKSTAKAVGVPNPTVPEATSSPSSDKLLDRYVLGKVLGQGAFGVVYSCKKKGGREEYAVKMIDQVETPLAEIKIEIEMLKKLEHTCVVKLHDVFYEKVFVCMVLEIYRGGDMIEGMQLHWKHKGMIAIPVVQNVSKMMVQSVEWLHTNSCVHRDLKGDNYLMDNKHIEHPNCRIYLSDFGTVVNLSPGERLKSKCGTKTYWAPEFYNLNYGLGVDIWAIGVIMFGLVTGRFPFKGEDDVKSKAVKCPQRITKDGESFIQGTLTRDEAKRLTAKQAIEHPFLSSVKSAAQVAEEKMDPTFKPDIKEGGANAGVQERRRELVERLNHQARKGHDPKAAESDEFLTYADVAKGFQVEDKFQEKKATFEWWSKSRCEEANLAKLDKAVPNNDDTLTFQATENNLRHMLEEHNILLNKFGLGQAKKFTEFVTEVQSGQSRLMLDATKHKCLVRTVDVVLLRIAHGTGSNKRYLAKTWEKYPDGRMRENINQLPGTKKLPQENARQTTVRLLEDRLQMKECSIVFDFIHKECFEDDEESPSYPGVRTVYRKELYEATVTATDPKVLAKFGLTGSVGEFNNTDSKGYTRSFCWNTEEQCIAKNVQLRAPAEGADISPLVHPPIGHSEEELQIFLQTSGVDIGKFGQDGAKTLKEFSDELIKGESQLVRQSNGNIMRVVDVVILLIRRQNGDLLIEASESPNAGGSVKALNRLPAVKRRPDENLFWAAKRVLGKVLKMSENLVDINPGNVMLVEESSKSTAYVGLPTIYRKRMIQATVLED